MPPNARSEGSHWVESHGFFTCVGGGDKAAFMYTLIVTAKMNDIDPQAWMADVLARLPDMPVSRLPELMPWNWKGSMELKRIAA